MSNNHTATRRNTREGYVVQVEGNGTVKFVSSVKIRYYGGNGTVQSVTLSDSLEDAELFDKKATLRRIRYRMDRRNPPTKKIKKVIEKVREKFNGFVDIKTFKVTITQTTKVVINEE